MTHDHTLRFRSSFTKGLPFALLLAANLAPWACTSREDGGLGPGGSPDVHDVGVSFDGGAEPDDLGAADAGRWPDAEAALADEGIAEGRSTTLVLRDGEGGAFAGAVVLVHGDDGVAEYTSPSSGRVVISDLARPTDVTVIWSPSVLTSLLGVEPGEEVVLDSELDATEASFGRLTVHATYPGATSIFVRACRSLVGPPANDPNPSNPADPFTVEVAACPLSGASGRAFVLAMAMGQALAVLPIDYTIVGGVARIDVGPDAPWILVGVAPIQIDPGLRFGTDYYADGYLCTP